MLKLTHMLNFKNITECQDIIWFPMPQYLFQFPIHRRHSIKAYWMFERKKEIWSKFNPLKSLCSLLKWQTKETLVYTQDLINSKGRSMVKNIDYMNFSFSKLFDVVIVFLKNARMLLATNLFFILFFCMPPYNIASIVPL